MQKHIQHNNDELTQFFRKIYLSPYWKGCVWEGVGDRTELQHIDPPSSSGHSSASFSFSWAAQLGAWGPSLSAERADSHRPIWNTDFKLWTPTAWLPVSPGLYHCFRPLNLTRRQSRLSPDLFNQMHLLFTQMYFSFDSLAGSEVNMQQD